MTAGANVLRWDRSPASAEQVFASLDFGVAQPRFSAWHLDAARLRWSAWGPSAPPAVARLETLEAGEIYFLDAPIASIWQLLVSASVFDGAQVVSFYGFPGVPSMGVLGRQPPAAAIEAVEDLAARYDSLNGELDVIPALHPIVAVAQVSPNADGTYLGRMAPSVIDGYVEAARAAGALVFLDVQIGWSDPLTEVRRLERFLRELDPEFATARYARPPGAVIGSLEAADVNAVQDYLATLVRAAERIPPKALVLHQFTPDMLRDTSSYEDVPELDIVVDMDGFGGPAVKVRHYEQFALAGYSEVPAIKLFFDWDQPLMSPATILDLEEPPRLIIYQ